MDQSLVTDWLKTLWAKHLELRPPSSMLVLDALQRHLTKNKTLKLKIDLAFIPGGMRSQSQVNIMFQDYLNSM